MRIVNIHVAKTKLSQLLVELENNNEPIRICRNGKSIAEIAPLTKKVINPLHRHKATSGIEILYNPIEPTSEEDWPSEFR